MADIQVGVHTVRSHGLKVAKVHRNDWVILFLLVAIQMSLKPIEPFHRFVGEEMMSDLKFPLKQDTVPFWAVQVYSVLFPIAIFLAFYFRRKDVYELHHAVLGLMFSVLINGVITDAIKVAAGRPRPNFFWRCFPDGKAVFDSVTRDVLCGGDEAVIKEGYKSFPSGHTSLSFAGLGFLAFYLSGKIRVFDRRGHIGKLCVFLFPLLVAALVGVSRVDDYWHHWQDVFVGGLIGITVASLCYSQTFPFPNDADYESNGGWSSLTKRNLLKKQSLETNNVICKCEAEAPRLSSSRSHLALEAMEAGRKY